ncbi:MAG: GspH/FimT family pseudopilin [Thermodesulfobacteriota bacterium]
MGKAVSSNYVCCMEVRFVQFENAVCDPQKKFNMKYRQRVRKLHRNSQGFTTVELIVVMAIMGVLMAIAIPNYSQWITNYRLKAAAREIYTNFQKARIEAIKTNSNVVVSFNAGAETYQVFVDNGGTTGTADDDTQNGDERILANVTMPASVVLDSVNFSLGSTTPGFTARGLPLSSRIGNVRVRNEDNVRYQISLSLAGGLTLERL